MLLLKSYKTELDPNNAQRTLLNKHAGVARFAWNWALNRRIEEYNLTGKASNSIEQHRQLNAIKQTDFPWMYEVSKCAPQEALRDLDKAFRNFFAKRALRATKVADDTHQPVEVVAEATESTVAGFAEQPANLAGFVVVIHGQHFRRSQAERALAVLQLSHFLELFDGEAVLLAKHTGPVAALPLFDRERLAVSPDLGLDGFAMFAIRGVLLAPLDGRAFALATNLVVVPLFPILLSRVVAHPAPVLQSIGGRSTFLKLGDRLCLSTVLASFGIHAIIVLACQQQSKCLVGKKIQESRPCLFMIDLGGESLAKDFQRTRSSTPLWITSSEKFKGEESWQFVRKSDATPRLATKSTSQPSTSRMARRTMRTPGLPRQRRGVTSVWESTTRRPWSSSKSIRNITSISRLRRNPRFKSKKRGLGGFRLTGSITIEAGRIKLPRIGWLRLKESDYLPTDAKINSVTVKERAGRWFVSVQVEEQIAVSENQGPAIGLDLGLKSFAVGSDGSLLESPKPLLRSLKRLQSLSRRHSHKQKGSMNRRKSANRLAKLHYRISCQRSDFLHKATSDLTRTKSVIVVEDLNVGGMLKNHRLARSISDAGWSEFVRQLEYKAAWHGSKIVKAGRFYPSTKTCSSCGTVKDTMPLSERTYSCEVCGLVLDRDVNAARNLLSLSTGSSPGFEACGDSPLGGSAKQEPSVV